MINFNNLEVGMILMSREEDLLWAEEPRKRYKALIGAVCAFNRTTKEVTLRINKELRVFKPENLWYLPYEFENATPASWMLKGFIISVAKGKVNPSTLQEIAEEFIKQGVKSTAPQELIEARV